MGKETGHACTPYLWKTKNNYIYDTHVNICNHEYEQESN